MCDPMSLAIASAATTAASATLSFVGQNEAYRANEAAAVKTYANTYNELGVRNTQIDAQQSENTLEALINRQVLRGRISASASSMGATGDAATIQAAQADNQVGRALSIENLTSDERRVQQGFALNAAGIERQSSINSKQPGSLASLALGFSDAALGGARTYHDLGGTF